MVARRYCVVCGERAEVALGIRARYENTNAVWAPNTGAYLCSLHAVSGLEVTIVVVAARDGHVRVRTRGEFGKAATVLPIGDRAQSVGADQMTFAELD